MKDPVQTALDLQRLIEEAGTITTYHAFVRPERMTEYRELRVKVPLLVVTVRVDHDGITVVEESPDDLADLLADARERIANLVSWANERG